MKDEAGFVLVFLAIALPALLALVGLAVDGLRFLSLDTDLANIADAAALAAANRLDRSEQAIPQARAAALALSNTPAGGRPDDRIGLLFRFAATVQDLERDPGYSLADSASADAAYVEVRTTGVTLEQSLLALVGVKARPLQRRAMARSAYVACDVTPTLLCVPDPAAFVAHIRSGQQMLLRMDGNLAPGSIALVDTPDHVNDRQTLRTLASDAPRFCFADRLRLRTTVAPSTFDEAVNVRFDRYQGAAGPIAPDLAVFPPAPDIIQGRHFATCLSPPGGGDINPPFPLPRDTAYRGVVRSGLWDQGAGDWRVAPPVGGAGLPAATAVDEYIAWNHADQGPAFQDRLRQSPTRYDLYLAELGLTRATDGTAVDTRSLGPSVATLPSGGPREGSLSFVREHPTPVCYAGTGAPVQPRRRILYLAITDCAALPDAETLSRTVGKFFLTEPTEDGKTLAEFVDLMRPTADDGKFRHLVALVRAE